MEVIKRKILLENFISRDVGPLYGTITATTFSLNIFLNQTIDNIGMFTDVTGGEYDITPHLYSAGSVSGYTSSRISELKKYNVSNPYEEFFYFDITDDNRVSTIFELSPKTGYTFNALNDSNLGTENQITGIIYYDLGVSETIFDDDLNTYIRFPKSTISYKGSGWNEDNISLSATVMEEKYLGIISPPKIESEVFIDRGSVSVLESHLRLSEIASLEHLITYNNGSYYNIIRQTI